MGATMGSRKPMLPPAVQAQIASLRGRWQALGARERRLVQAGVTALAVLLVWTLLLQPALRTLRDAPAKLDRLDAQLQQMQRLAAEGRELRNAAPVSAAQATEALKAATDRLGERAKLALQGDRGVLTLTGVTGQQLQAWLAEARSGARARPVEVQLSRSPQGYNGTVVVAIGQAAP